MLHHTPRHHPEQKLTVLAVHLSVLLDRGRTEPKLWLPLLVLQYIEILTSLPRIRKNPAGLLGEDYFSLSSFSVGCDLLWFVVVRDLSFRAAGNGTPSVKVPKVQSQSPALEYVSGNATR